jgi:very-short-patch-repair endonuclease
MGWCAPSSVSPQADTFFREGRRETGVVASKVLGLLGWTMDKLAHARRMRAAPSATERLLWALLRDRRLESLKFRRQVPVGPYIADFLCLRHRLIVEADGPFHDATRDAERDAWLAAQNFRALRFGNEVIRNDRQAVLDAIAAAALGDIGLKQHDLSYAGARRSEAIAART